MSPIAVAALVFALGATISMSVAGLIRLLFLAIQALQRRAVAAAAAEPGLPMLGDEAGEGGVTL